MEIKAGSQCFNCLIVIIVLLYLRVWNEAVAHRLTTLGHSARRGDLVWMREEQKKVEDPGETSLPQVRENRKYKKKTFAVINRKCL